jgi:hypothetical protein
VDDFCLKPDLWIELAQQNHADFRASSSADNVGYPGLELTMPDLINNSLTEFFIQYIRPRMNSRRVIYSTSRLAMVTLAEDQLRPAQSICHRDLAREPGGIMTASVLYLFKDANKGGTSFYAPKKSHSETMALVQDSLSMSAEAFHQRYGIAQRYLLGSNDYFEQIGSVEAKWNRIVFYDGDMYHSADILQPKTLSADPTQGRLTLNGFFYCTKKAG